MSSTTARTLREFYQKLLKAYGPQGWWPGRTKTEIVVGAILTQNTNWRNVERAIAQLRAAGLLNWTALRDVPVQKLAQLIRPAGYFNVKARRLKNFVNWLWQEYGGNLNALRRTPLFKLRNELLSVNGIGPETADSILLYALDRPSFVVDVYTRRLATRHGLISEESGYDDLKALFEENLPRSVPLFNEYHALVVAIGKRHCGPRARCMGCPLEHYAHDAAAH